VTSDARARPQEEDAATAGSAPDETPAADSGADASAEQGAERNVPGGTDDTAEDVAEDVAEAKPAAKDKAPRRRSARGGDGDGPTPSPSRPSLPLVPALAVLLVLLLAGVGYLWVTRPASSSVRTDDYVQVLQAARSGVVDMTSFDYLTLDDDLVQIKRVTTGDLQKEAVAQLDSRRQQITESQATVNTEVVGAGVTSATTTSATVLLVIQSTQKSSASEQAQVLRYRIRVEMEKKGGRWLLSGIAGTGTGNNG
jgi:Mce-associated membrane protein